ncbi:MAG: BrnT family toxin [Pseudomonadota bacterium]
MAIALEWDEKKRQSNRAKHGVDFADLARFEWETALAFPDDYIDGERRHRELGLLDDRIIFVVYTERPNAIRMISARVATRRERDFYVQYA